MPGRPNRSRGERRELAIPTRSAARSSFGVPAPVVAYAAYVLIFAALAVVRWQLRTYGTDTGTFAQVISDTFGGFRDGPEQGTHFRFHWSPLLAVLWPLVALARSPLVLQFAQPVLIGACVFPLYALARRYASENTARACAALALIYPPLLAVAFGEFHEIAFFPVLALALVWAADGSRWALFALFAVAIALVREDVCIVAMVLGLALAVLGALGRRRGASGLLLGEPREAERTLVAGLGLAALSAGALGFYFGIVVPHAGGWHPSRFYDYPFAHGPLALLAALALHPAYFAQVMSFGRLTYVLEAFLPLALLPLGSRWSLLALPGFAVVLLSSDQIAWRMGSHYAALWIPWLLLGATAVVIRRERAGRANAARRGLWIAATVCVIVLAAFNPMHPAHYLRSVYPNSDIERALASLPPGASVVTHDEWYSLFALRLPNSTVFLCRGVRYAVYADDFPNGYYQHEVRAVLATELGNGTMRRTASFGNVRVYERDPGRLTPLPECREVAATAAHQP